MKVAETGNEFAHEASKKLLSKLDTKIVLKLIMETQLNRINPIYITKDLPKEGLEVQQLVGLLSVVQADVYFILFTNYILFL
jgi:hypothetical protein